MDEEARIIERAQRGDGSAFDAIVARFQREIYFLVLRMLKNEEDAEEVAQQAFVNAWNKLDSFRGGSAFRTWLYRIAINLATTHLRKKARQGGGNLELADEHPGNEQEPLDRLILNETAKEALDQLHTLGEKQRMVVMLRIVHELPYREIGDIVGCTEQTAKVHFHYGVDNLRKRMTSHDNM